MAITLTVNNFWTSYDEFDKDGVTPKAIDWVAFSPPPMGGEAPKSEVFEKVHRMDPKSMKLLPGQPADDEKSKFFAYRWSIIGPAYLAWKSGQEIPLNGTPLAAWGGIVPGQIEVLKRAGIKTVEDLAGLNDNETVRIHLPNARDIRDLAKAYLESRDATAVALREAEQAKRMADMEERMHAQDEVIKQLMANGGKLTAEEPDIDALRAELDTAGIPYDKRWGIPKLREALNTRQAA
jgi:hypothetical protein